jgi:hypothetical protein
MRYLARLSFMIAPCLIAGALRAQDITLDLSTLDAGKTSTQPLPRTGTLTVSIANALPNTAYSYQTQYHINEHAIPPLTVDFKNAIPLADQSEGSREAFKATYAVPLLNGECSDPKRDSLTAAVVALEAVTDEQKVPDILAGKLVQSVDTVKDLALAGKCGEQATKAMNDLRRTAFSVPGSGPKVSAGQDLVITVSRFKAGKSDKTWTATFEGQDRGKWQMSYGFGFVYNQWSPSNTYTSKEVTGVANTYTVTNTHNPERLSFFPTIYYGWIPSGSGIHGWQPAWGVGVGFDLSNPAIFPSFDLVYNKNVTLHLGVAVAKVNKLRGQYHEGDTIKTNLTPDELVQSVYRINPSFAISLNTVSDLFGSSGSSADKNAAKKTTTSGSDNSKPKAENKKP